MRRFEMTEGTSNKFWEIALKGNTVSVRFGRIGTDGALQAKVHPSKDTARAQHDKLIKEKLGKGYREIRVDGAKSTETKVSSPLETGIVEKLFADFEALTRRVEAGAVGSGKFTFPKGALAKWRTRKIPGAEETVGVRLDRFARELADGKRFVHVTIDGDAMDIRAWDWLDEWETLDGEIGELVEVAAKAQAKGKLVTRGRFTSADGKWVTRTAANGKCAIDEGDGWDEKKASAMIESLGSSRNEWLATHPATQRRIAGTRRWGFVDRDGREVVAPTFTSVDGFSEGFAVVHEGWTARFLDRGGKVRGEFAGARRLSGGLAPVAPEDTGSWGYADAEGTMRIPAAWANASTFFGPLAVVSQTFERSRWITRKGELVGDPFDFYQYDARNGFHDGRAWVFDNEKRSFACIDEQGQQAIARRFANALQFSEGVAAVCEIGGTRWGYIDRSGNTVVDPQFDEAYPFAEGRALVRAGASHRLIDRSGKYVSGSFDSDASCAKQFAGGRLPVKVKSQTGWIDGAGSLVIPARWAMGGAFYEGRAAIGRNTKNGVRWGFVDEAGNEVIAPAFENANWFVDGRAAVQRDRLWGYVAADGSLVIEPQYRAVQSTFAEGVAAVQLM